MNFTVGNIQLPFLWLTGINIRNKFTRAVWIYFQDFYQYCNNEWKLYRLAVLFILLVELPQSWNISKQHGKLWLLSSRKFNIQMISINSTDRLHQISWHYSWHGGALRNWYQNWQTYLGSACVAWQNSGWRTEVSSVQTKFGHLHTRFPGVRHQKWPH